MAGKAERDVLERLAFEAVTERIAPRNREAAIRRTEKADDHAAARENRSPAAIRSELGPTRAAERKDCDIGARGIRRGVCGTKDQTPGFIPSQPLVPRAQPHALRGEARQPGPQQGRGFQGLGKDASARSDENLLAQALRPGDQGAWRKRFQDWREPVRRRAIARDEAIEGFGMGEIESTAAGDQELAPRRRHALINRHAKPGGAEKLGCHQSGRAGSDNRDGRRGVRARL